LHRGFPLFSTDDVDVDVDVDVDTDDDRYNSTLCMI
jgi:hypothetical protein